MMGGASISHTVVLFNGSLARAWAADEALGVAPE